MGKPTDRDLQDYGLLFSAFAENAVDSIFFKNLDRRYTYVNPAMERVLGLSGSEILGKTPEELFSAEDAAVVAEVDDAALRGETVDAVRTLHIDDHGRTFQTVQFPVHDRRQKIIGIGGYVRDLTESQQAKDDLQLAHDELEQAVDERTKELAAVNEDLQDKIVALEKTKADIAARNRKLEIVNRIISLSAGVSTVEELAEGVVNSILELMRFDQGGFYVLDHEAKVAICRYHAGGNENFQNWVERLPIDNPKSRPLYIEGRPMYIEDFRVRRPELAADTGPLSAAAIPIVIGGKVVATIGVGSRQPHIFSAFEKQVLETIGKELGNTLDRLRTQKELRKSEERFRRLAEQSSDVIWMRDLDFRPTYISPSVMRLRGFTPEEAKTQTVEQGMTPESAARVQQTLMEEMANEADDDRRDPTRARSLEVEMLRKDGSTVWCEVISSFMRDEDGRPTGTIGVTRDISERKRAVEELKESEARARALLLAIPDVMFRTDGDGTFLEYYTSRPEQLYLPPEQFLGKRVTEVLPPPIGERALESIRQVLDTGATQTLEYEPVLFTYREPFSLPSV